MDELIKINYDTEEPTVSARDLHEGLEIKTAFKDWFPRMAEYGFLEGKDFCSKMSESTGGRPAKDFDISVDMAKRICMIQRTDKGRQYRQYFLDLEKAWNTPDQVMARALKMANRTIDSLKERCSFLGSQVIEKTKTDRRDAAESHILRSDFAVSGSGVYNCDRERLWNECGKI